MDKQKKLKRNVNEVIKWSREQRNDPTQSWKGLCQSHCRQAYGVPAWSPSAIGAWRRIPADFKHRGNVEDAPRGAILYYSGGQYGHAAIAAGKKTNTKCLSNDYMSQGQIGYAPRDFARWGLKYVGWSNWTPYGILDVEK